MEPTLESQRTAEQDGKQPAKLSVMKPIRRKGVARRTSGKKSAAAVACFRKRRPGTIHQRDLEEAIVLKRLARDARERSDEMELYLRLALQAGAAVEPGVRTAKLKAVVEIE